jgi:ABC-type antimicrobial peptide transport system permease subunit
MKNRYVLRNIINSLKSDRKRLILSMFGIALSISILSFLVLNVSFLNTIKSSEFTSFPENTILYKDSLSSKFHSISESLEEEVVVNEFSEGIIGLNDFFSSYNFESFIFQVELDYLDAPVIVNYDENYVEDRYLLHGRNFSYFEKLINDKTVHITETSALLLFGSYDVIGENLLVSVNDQSIEFEIIGIVSDSFKVKQMNQNENFVITLFTNYDIELDANYTIIVSNYDSESFSNYFIEEGGLKEDSVYTYYKHQRDFFDTNKSQNQVLDIILFSLLFFTTLNIFVITMFVVKDRVHEIGIRLAIGATRFDILTQLTLETFFISIVSSIIGASVGILSYNVLSSLTLNDYHFIIRQQDLFSIFQYVIIFTLAAIIATLLPYIYLMKKSILTLLRFE